MPIGQLITLGIGTPSSIPLLDLTGLYISPLGTGGSIINSVSIDTAITLTGNVVYSLSGRAVYLYWDTADVIEASVDLITWTTLTAGQETCAPFIRPVSEVVVVAKKVRKM